MLACLGMLVACSKDVGAWRADLAAEEPFARVMAAIALGETGDASVVPDLIGVLDDDDEAVRDAGRDALVRLGEAAVPALLEAFVLDAPSGPDGLEAATVLLGEIGAAAVPVLSSALREPARYDRIGIALALGRIGRPAVAPLADLLVDEDVGLAVLAARALEHVGRDADAAVPALVTSLGRSPTTLRLHVARALGAIGPDNLTVLPALLALGRDPDPAVRDAGLQAAVSGLLRRLAFADATTHDAARARLAALGFDAMPGLITVLRTGEPAMADGAVEWLGRLGPAVVPPLLASLGERNLHHIERIAAVVRHVGRDAVTVLHDLLAEPGHRDRVKAATALGGLGQMAVETLPTLLTLLDDPDPNMPIAAAYAIGHMVPPDAESLDAVMEAVEARNQIVRRAAMPAVVNGLLARIALQRDDAARRRQQLLALGLDATPVLAQAVRSNDRRIAEQAEAALVAIESSLPP